MIAVLMKGARHPDRGDLRQAGLRGAPLRLLHDGARAASSPVVGGLGDERLEEPCVLAGLGMPEHADREAPAGGLERLDVPVLVARGRAQPVAERGRGPGDGAT